MNTYRHKIIKIIETAALIGRLNFLRTQFREASLYLMIIDSAKTRAVKTQGWTGMMVSPLEALKELYRDRCLTPRVGSNTGTRFLRGSSSSWSMAKLPNTLDKQQERTAGHSLRNNSFRMSSQRATDKLSLNQFRQLYMIIRIKKTESSKHFNTSSDENLPHQPTFEHKNSNTIRSRKDKYNKQCSQQIMQVRRLSPSPIISGSNKNDMDHPTNARFIRIINNKTITSICYSEHK
ncbi:MAG: hypothetical protein EZS28_000223 [Streblomastix strix]|uniref:Uncharacterized protein n=1 Tax=Streblomastix strix TaxID=222440 RepID=A0A5J4XBP7_9EUKA|nr:MAG: hypothetical protein EZS28_000223 [Streblomastix strix]